jgi:molybdate transport system substrate-binding protein
MPLDRRSGIRLLPALLCLAVGCGESPSSRPKLRVAAASDLQHALPILISAYRIDHDVEIEPTFGASGQLAEQIRQGAPFDLFLSANAKFVEKLKADGTVLPDSVRAYAQGKLALVVSKSAKIEVKTLDDLAKPEVKKVAIANPELAPYGLAAKQALQRSGVWERIQDKVVLAETVRQALQFVQSGNAEAGLVGRAIADVPEVDAIPVKPALFDPIVQVLGVVAKGEQVEEAKGFAKFLTSEDGQRIFQSLGFSRSAEGPEGEAP